MSAKQTTSIIFLLIFSTIVVYSCSKGGGGGGGTPNPCAGVTVVVNATVTNATTVGGSNGSINATATGGANFTFSINGGAFQASGNFTGLVKGTYTVTAKSADGCTGSKQFTITEPDPCAGGNGPAAQATVQAVTPCGPANGSITVTVTGGTAPFTYSLNGGAFQASNIFNSLGTGNYTVTVKDANNCQGSANPSVGNQPAGPLFAAVRTLINNNCTSCHNGTLSEGGMNFTVDCNIVNNKDRIKARAVDANPSVMPPTGFLPASERQKIVDWINAGGTFVN